MERGELRDYATVVAATVALLVFVVSSSAQVRNRRIENLARFRRRTSGYLPSGATLPGTSPPSRQER